MKKYIDAEKLIAGIEKRQGARQDRRDAASWENEYWPESEFCTRDDEDDVILSIIASLQQEQPQLPGIEDPGIPGKDFIPVEWVEACKMYGKWKIVKQEQPEVDIEKELIQWHKRHFKKTGTYEKYSGFYLENSSQLGLARHFYGLRNLALEEAARHVYESWMGGTMDDVRRDMVELGRVINARKEE